MIALFFIANEVRNVDVNGQKLIGLYVLLFSICWYFVCDLGLYDIPRAILGQVTRELNDKENLINDNICVYY